MAKALTITNQAEWDAASRDERLECLLGDVWRCGSDEFKTEMRAAYDRGIAQSAAGKAEPWRAAA